MQHHLVAVGQLTQRLTETKLPAGMGVKYASSRPKLVGTSDMAGKTLTRADLSEAVYNQVGLSRSESSSLVESVLEEICQAAVRGETIKLSSFGTFSVRSKNERIGRNPKTGEEVPITPRRVMVFRPSNIMKGKVLEGNRGRKT